MIPDEWNCSICRQTIYTEHILHKSKLIAYNFKHTVYSMRIDVLISDMSISNVEKLIHGR